MLSSQSYHPSLSPLSINFFIVICIAISCFFHIYYPTMYYIASDQVQTFKYHSTLNSVEWQKQKKKNVIDVVWGLWSCPWPFLIICSNQTKLCTTQPGRIYYFTRCTLARELIYFMCRNKRNRDCSQFFFVFALIDFLQDSLTQTLFIVIFFWGSCRSSIGAKITKFRSTVKVK